MGASGAKHLFVPHIERAGEEGRMEGSAEWALGAAAPEEGPSVIADEAAGLPRYHHGDLFTLCGVSFAYRDGRRHGARHPVFDDLDLTIREGRVTALVGANGCGKTTLLELLAKGVEPDTGAIYLRRGSVAALRPHDLARLVAIVRQHGGAPEGVTVEELVSHGRVPYHVLGAAIDKGLDERWIRWALSACGLEGLRGRPVSALSASQLRRAWVAMGLAQGTRVLLLDEPTASLDLRHQVRLLRFIRRLNRELGVTVVMALGDVNQAFACADEVVALADGRVVAQGTPDEVADPALLGEVFGVELDVVRANGHPLVIAG